MSNIKDQLIKLGSDHPELREHIRPVLDRLSDDNDENEDPCWEGYEMAGMKEDEHGNKVPNCIPKESSSLENQLIHLGSVHPELRDHLRPVLNRMSSTMSPSGPGSMGSELDRTMKSWIAQRTREYANGDGMSPQRAADKAVQDFFDKVRNKQKDLKELALNRL